MPLKLASNKDFARHFSKKITLGCHYIITESVERSLKTKFWNGCCLKDSYELFILEVAEPRSILLTKIPMYQ